MIRSPRRLATALLCLGLLAACGSESADGEGGEEGNGGGSSVAESTEPTEAAEQEEGQGNGEALQGPAGVEPTDATSATLHTSEGDITVTLFPDEAPLTVTNFVGLADGSLPWEGQEDGEPLYNGTIFHRVIDGFMIQGGDPLGSGMGGPGYQFEDEFDSGRAFEEPYLLAMANSGPGTNGSQFFITVEPTPHLNNLHTIFGEVADDESRAVVDAIAGTETGPNDKPVQDVVIESISVG
ncbi:peptidylprolyl isomerase [Streptomyces triticirhizae]|uniref:Peptidyl-prolyl cis-trans isomerase n=1 Tax=Streptomyces triticirhizae TaxID=2483353 RepID=A0A3M2LAG5_9ACTN|nr:peptidylprolyl isomerase [Streptomyces triticirhizae]